MNPVETDRVESFDILKHIAEQAAWSVETFGPGKRTEGVVDHIRKELDELLEHPDDYMEAIDIIMLGIDLAQRQGQTPQQICENLAKKLQINKARTWPDWRQQPADKAIRHVPATSPIVKLPLSQCRFPLARRPGITVAMALVYTLHDGDYQPALAVHASDAALSAVALTFKDGCRVETKYDVVTKLKAGGMLVAPLLNHDFESLHSLEVKTVNKPLDENSKEAVVNSDWLLVDLSTRGAAEVTTPPELFTADYHDRYMEQLWQNWNISDDWFAKSFLATATKVTNPAALAAARRAQIPDTGPTCSAKLK